MKNRISALLVHQQAEPLRALDQALTSQSIQTTRARSCREAGLFLNGANPPHLVFTDTTLPDGSWAEVIALAAKATIPVNVIVVGRGVDTRFYVEAIEAGAYDFVVPPFAAPELAYVVQCAADNVLACREALARAQQSPQKLLFPPSLAIRFAEERGTENRLAPRRTQP
jgi:DNA-binding NtrC family response regulator